jgi:hypothetical protein
LCRRTDIPEGKRKKDFLSAVEAAQKVLQERRTESMKSVDALARVLRQKSQEYLKGSAVPQPHPQLTRVLTRGLSRAADAAASSAKAYEPRTSLGVMIKSALFDEKATQASDSTMRGWTAHGFRVLTSTRKRRRSQNSKRT